MTSDPVLRIGSFLPATRAEGPGTRFAVWVQGCSLRCHGCFNPHLWGTHGGRDIAVADLLDAVPWHEVEGVTLLGGEPFEQPEPLARFAEETRARGASVMTFSGYTLDELRAREDAGVPGVGDLLAATDLLIDGPYRQDLPDLERPWTGSTNQGFRLLTDRYAHLSGEWNALPDTIEVRVAPDGSATVNGWATSAALELLLEGLSRPSSR